MPSASHVAVEVQFAGPVTVARNAEISAYRISASELEAVVAMHFADVVNELVLAFVLVERAIACVNIQGVAKLIVGTSTAAVFCCRISKYGMPDV